MTKVKITPVISYKLETEDGTYLGVFTKESEWEQMTKLVSVTKQVIVESDVKDLFDGLFGNNKDEPRLAQVISATPGVFPKTSDRSEA